MTDPILIAYDESDPSLGHFFQLCSDIIRENAVLNAHDYKLLSSTELTRDKINCITEESIDFVFACFTHGDENSLYCNKLPFVTASENLFNFYGSFFYTFACSSAVEIAKEFENSYVQGFFGYSSDVHVKLGFEEAFADCATVGLIAFLEGNSLKNCKQIMENKYTETAVDISKQDYLAALLLLNNRDVLYILGEEELVISY